MPNQPQVTDNEHARATIALLESILNRRSHTRIWEKKLLNSAYNALNVPDRERKFGLTAKSYQLAAPFQPKDMNGVAIKVGDKVVFSYGMGASLDQGKVIKICKKTIRLSYTNENWRGVTSVNTTIRPPEQVLILASQDAAA